MTVSPHANHSDSRHATLLRRVDLVERDAMVVVLHALGTERLQSMLNWIKDNPRNKERWDSVTVAGVQMIVDPHLLRAELLRRDDASRSVYNQEKRPASHDGKLL